MLAGQQLSPLVKTTRVKNAVAAGTGDTVQSDAVDMADFEGVRFTVLFGTITSSAVTTVKAQQSSTAGLAGTEDDLAGTAQSVADTDDNKAVVIDVYRPIDRYVNVAVVRATANAVIDGIIAEQYGARKVPTTDDTTTVVGREVHVSPAEGTA